MTSKRVSSALLATLVLAFLPDVSGATTTFERRWQWFLGSTGRSVGLAEAGGYVVSGETQVETNRYGVVAVGTDSTGDTVWVRHFTGMDAGGGYSCRTTDNGTAVLAESAGLITIRKLNVSGDRTWAYRSAWGGPISGIIATADGGCLVYGRIPLAEYDMGAIKLAADGREEWTRWYDEPRTFDSWARGACEVAGDGFVLCGIASDYMGVYQRLVRLTASGDTVWTRLYDGQIAPDLGAVAETGDRGFIIAGKAYDTLSALDAIHLLRTDSSGARIWTRNLALPGAATRAAALRPTDDGGFILCGTIDWFDSSRVLLVKLDADADTVWTRVLAGEGVETGADVWQADDGGFIVAGTSNNGTRRILLTKTDAFGNTATEEPGLGTPPLARIMITPNPATSSAVLLSLAGTLGPLTLQPLLLSISDISGRCVFSSFIPSPSAFPLDLQSMSAGVYLVKLSADGFSATQKLVIQH